MDLSMPARHLPTATPQCLHCGAAVGFHLPPPTLRRPGRAFRAAWFLLACLFALGLLWSNRFEYALCDVDGCVRIDRWNSRVEWIGSDIDALPDDETLPVQARLGRGAAAHLAATPR